MFTGRNSKDLAQRIFDEIDASFSEEVRFLQRLIRIQTVNPPGRYEEIADFLQSFGQEHGLEAEVSETPIEICRAAGVEAADRRLSVKLTAENGKVRPRILLLAHLDTVPIGDMSGWRHDPFGGEIDDARIYGRGACDCKGRISAYVYSVLALAKALKVLPCEVSVAATADEEIGGRTGAKYLLETGKLDCDYCIGEGYTWEVFNGFKGLLWVRISIKGVSAHGATPHLGASAVRPFAQLFTELHRYQTRIGSLKETDGTTVNIGIVKAGTKINMVPESATIEIDLRVGESYKVKKALTEISEIMKRVEDSHRDLSFNFEVINQSEPISLAPTHPLVRVVHSSVEEVTRTPIPVSLWFAHSDTLHFLQRGIPAVNYGVGKAGVPHTANEYVDLDDLKLSTKAIALSILKLMSESAIGD